MNNQVKNNRIWEIDLLRAVAITLMVAFHIAYDLNEFLGLNVPYESPAWFWVGKSSALLFIFISGISSGLSKNSAKRGIRVFMAGMLITVITFFMFREEYIRFGILHFLGLCMILFPAIKRLGSWMLFAISILSLAAGMYFDNITVNTWLLVPFGLMYRGFSTLDYVPVFPYISVFILGVMCYRFFYREKRSIFNFNLNLGFIKTISKNSLAIYLVHQPVLFLVILGLKIFIKK